MLKCLNGFKSTNKIDNYNNRGKKAGEGKKWKEKNPETATAAAAAAAKSLQSCPTLCDPVDGSPPGSPVPGIL